MSQSLANIVIHIIFSTKERKPLTIDKPTREQLFQYDGGILTNRGCSSIIVGGVEDHMHLLCRFSRTETISDLVKQVKRGTSDWLKSNSYHGFAWQSGYGAFSVSSSQVDTVIEYISKQEERHKIETFQTEFRKILEKSKTSYDERYVWD